MRDFSRLDERLNRLKDGLSRKDELRQGILAALEDAVVEETRNVLAGYVVFSDVRRARPHAEELIDFVRHVRERFGNAPLPGV